MTNDDGVVTNQDIFDQQAHDPLPFLYIERFGRRPQAGEEASECFGKAKVGGAFLLLIDKGLELGLRGLLALTQRRHSFSKLVNRDQVFLVSREQSIHAFS